MHEPIAIVGSACRFPGGASTPSKLWDLLREPRDVGGRIPADRFSADGFYHADAEHHGTSNVVKGYFLSEDHRHFDTAFFNSNPKEAEVLDPQQRILLETTYEAMESAGLTIEGMKGTNTSVYVGLMGAEYFDLHLRDPETAPQYLASCNARCIISNRLSYFFDWTGPSMTIDTACSSSLIALHHAVQSLRTGEANVAVAAGANLILGPEVFIIESNLHMLSPTGRSQMWDASADGYARGEGFAVVMLKTLRNALRDGDHIECIIRETGVNADGKTKGITMPRANTQTTLIRETYQRAGLDCTKNIDRCQFFEAHGTGTPTGDPIEAKAVWNAFFPTLDSVEPGDINGVDNERLFVGSAKTVIGHTEGTAGLAGVLKASLAVQNRIIPPNMHFRQLNPNITSFYDHMRIPTKAQAWPVVPRGHPLRASVNSFGFGGANAHAIIESFDAESQQYHCTRLGPLAIPPPNPSLSLFGSGYTGPLVLSANSESSLSAAVEAMSNFLKANKAVNLMDLGWTLQSRRTVFPIKVAFSGLTREKLIDQMDAQVRRAKEAGATVGTPSPPTNFDSPDRILGVFTGQGAQWASMGRELIKHSHVFSQSIDHLEQSLAELPNPPGWSLKQELMADASSSRLDVAEISQPLCTAVQVGLIDLLACAEVSFDAVIGHSSGEIACAYAAGYLTASDTIRIAYYRGLHAKLAGNSKGGCGAMMAVGISLDEASGFCAQTQFANRIAVAASNAPNSVTLSGDEDAIREAKAVFDDRKTFARLLKVDTAYHSHHMQPCSKPYLESLRACKIQVQTPQKSCTWISSVYGLHGKPSLESLKDAYWERNMVNPVLFSQATERALNEEGPFNIILEVGPHPALRGPTTQTVKQIEETNIPYKGLLSRGDNDIEAFSDGLGFVWTHLGVSAVNFQGYASAFLGKDVTRRVVKKLPAYFWDHDQVFWKESRLSRRYRMREQPHELLGARCPDDTGEEMRWRNIIRVEEIPWLKGHRVQGEVVVPAAYYCVMALEAAKSLAKGEATRLVEIQDFVIYRAITLGESTSGAETLFSLKRVDVAEGKGRGGLRILTADFLCQSCAVERSDSMANIFSGRLQVAVGDPSPDVLPKRASTRPGMWPIDINRFYSNLSEIGLNYSDMFQKIVSAQRRLGIATASVPKPSVDGSRKALAVHPALLDTAFQSSLAALASPDDGTLHLALLPTAIRTLRINSALCEARLGTGRAVNMDSFITGQAPSTATGPATVTADIDIFSSEDDQMEIQVEGLTLTSLLTKPTDDRRFFTQTVWRADISGGPAVTDAGDEDSPENRRLIAASERASYYYYRTLLKQIPKEKLSSLEWHHKHLVEFAEHIVTTVDADQHPTAKKEWSGDTHNQILNIMSEFPGQIDIELVRAVGENLPFALLGKTALLEVMMANTMLDRFYETSIGHVRANSYLARIAQQIAHRYPLMNILEIGGGTGGATKRTLEALGDAFSSYTFTDISPGFFENARETFRRYAGKMTYKVFDVEDDPVAQGFQEHSYDLVIASNVLHATRKLKNTLTNVRRILKPGGYMLLLEITSPALQTGFIFGGLPGWWLGHEDGRPHGPTVPIARWDSLLRETGFAGVDCSANDFKDVSNYKCSVMVCQAISEEVESLRRPLRSPAATPLEDKLLIIGGNTLQTAGLVTSTHALLSCWENKTVTVKALEDVDAELVSSATTVLSLVELERPIFESMTPQSLKAMQALSAKAKKVLWVTHDTRDDNPYGNMTIGLGRCILMESPHIRFQFLILEGSEVTSINAQVISETLLRLMMADLPAISEGSVLWTTEPELVLKDGKLLVPRILSIPDMDDRLNSARRFITKPADPTVSAVENVWSDSSQVFREGRPLRDFLQADAGHTTIQVTHSSCNALKATAESYLFLCTGVVTKTGARVIALCLVQHGGVFTDEGLCSMDEKER